LLPSTATFIYNQISHHIRYEPHILYAEDIQGVMAREMHSKFPCRKIADNKIGEFLYHKLRILTPGEIRRGIQFINELKPDIIHVHYGVDMLVYSQILKKVNIPIVVSFYGYDCSSFPKRFYGIGKFWLQRSVFKNKNLKAVFAMSPDMEKDLIAIGCPKNIVLVHYYGSECKSFKIERNYSKKETINFSIISSFAAKKGHLILLKAWKQFSNEKNKNIKLMIIGSGELKDEISKFIKENSLNTVILKGPVQYGSAAHHEALNNTDVFVHPSMTLPNGDKEGIPGSIIEAMASGLPVISTFHAGIPYIVQPGKTGILVEERNVDQLTNAITKLATDQTLRETLGKNAQAYALSSLDIHTKEIELETLYDKFIMVHSNEKKLIHTSD
jgi:colanic acid/amylovoran biosynthesis glycosyltransferase